ncbi:hypothetical protein M8A51_13095 [Schlegelella sp. S2-27]|uniref:Saccharopine dehydrogenase n=1 Tax=Caldimonas mangrovi TaxID=2944811 RepID=A0ABT0YQ56_9BURK|nr:hypothetical protein [Caldimonas mangrovi]MCM5680464.1 hypothetical protein [Caldimonas mangrovi]
MNTPTPHPVLFVGGSGLVGRHAVRALRRLQPDLPIAIGGRDLDKAQRLAGDIGNAAALRIDLERADLGLPHGTQYSGVVVLLKDDTLNTMKYAQDHGLPYLSFADFVFDIGPLTARSIHRPKASAVLALGQLLGGTVALATLHFARAYRRVDSVEIAAVIDADDSGGPAGQADFERLAHSPRPLLRREGRFVWAGDEHLKRRFIDVDGIERTGDTLPLLDVASLSAALDAQSVRVVMAARGDGERRQGGRSTEAIIELQGQRADGTTGRSRHAMVDRNVYSALSGYGAAIAVERLLGLDGQAPPGPGLYQPESLLDPAAVVQRLQRLEVELRDA